MMVLKKSTKLIEVFADYISSCQYSKQLRPQTIKSYQDVFNTFQKIMPEIRDVEDLRPQMMAEFFKRISTRKRTVGNQVFRTGVKPSTVRTYYNKLLAFFRWLELCGYIELGILTDNIIKPPNPIYSDEKALTGQEVSKIISAIALYNSDDIFTYKRDLLIISLFVYTGVRRQEMLSLRIVDIDFQSRTLFINGATSKGKKSRHIPIHPMLLHQLKSYLEHRKKRSSTCDALVVSTKADSPFTKHGLKHWVSRYRRLSGVRFHVHQARHTFACSLAREKADVTSIMKVMGHSTIRTTEIYLRSITTEDSRGYIDKLSF